MLEYNEQTENLMEIAMMLEQLKGESEYLFEVLTDIDSITWKQKFVDWANEFTETYEPNRDVWPGNYLEVIEGVCQRENPGVRRSGGKGVMILRRAAKGIVRKGKKPSVYRIGFNDGDETELTANGINELEKLWLSLCPEFECEPDSVDYVERVGYEEED